MNTFDEVRRAVTRANVTLSAADAVSIDMAVLLEGRLRSVGNHFQGRQALSALKRELRDWNMKTETWK